jgi:DNA-binding FadR family transcriptional regulator
VSTREHRAIVDRIAAGQPAAAGRALQEHVMASRARMHAMYGNGHDAPAAPARRTVRSR